MTRAKLPNRRARTHVEFDHWNRKFTGGIGHYKDGKCGEVFLGSGKTGQELDIVMKDAAIAISLAIQHGCSSEVLLDAFLKNEDGTPASPMGKVLELVVALDNGLTSK